MDGTLALYDTVQGPKKLDILTYPPMNPWPFVDAHDEMFAWYDHFLKGIDNGVADGDPLAIHVEGSHEESTGTAFPTKEIAYAPLYLRPRHKLDTTPEPMGPEYAEPEQFTQMPMTLTNDTTLLSWFTSPFSTPAEVMGTGAAHLHIAIDQDDTNFILRLWDVASNGKHQLVTTGYLKASHNELDEERSIEGNPMHPHTSKSPITPGEIIEYIIRIYPMAHSFQPGHRLVTELSNNEPMSDEHNALLPPDAFHLPIGRRTMTTVYRDALHESRLLLPFTKE